MKTYIATYYRHNPQLSSGGYQTTRKIEAVSITSARKKAREITEGCVYGSLELLGVEKEGYAMMMDMTEADYESWRDDLRCGGQEEYDTQYSAASLYEGGWRARDLPDLIEQYNLTSEEANRIYDELLQIEQSAQNKED